MTIKDTINKYVTDTKSDLIMNYVNTGRKASGNWEKELESKTEYKGNNIKITFLGSSYTQQLTLGRRPNKDQNKDSIRAFVGWAGSTFLAEWVKNKGIQANPFAVANKIATKGITVPNQFNKGDLISGIFSDDKIDRLLKSVLGVLSGQIKTDLVKGLS